MKADHVGSRIAHLTIDVHLIPPHGPLGETDAAMEFGRQIAADCIQLLRIVAEHEGFAVETELRMVVY